MEEEEKVEIKSNSGMIISIITVAIIILLVGFVLYTKLTLDKDPLTIDELHQKNLGEDETDSNYIYGGFSFVEFDEM